MSVEPESTLSDIPNVVGRKLEDARSQLQAAGFVTVVLAESQNSDGSVSPGQGKTVWKQQPAGGKGNAGATVTIWINPARN